MDIPLNVSVELGRSQKYIREIIDINAGTIIILDKLADEEVDVVVNGIVDSIDTGPDAVI
jgi:flagellar motor switch protein FliN/FliY